MKLKAAEEVFLYSFLDKTSHNMVEYLKLICLEQANITCEIQKFPEDITEPQVWLCQSNKFGLLLNEKKMMLMLFRSFLNKSKNSMATHLYTEY